MTSSRIYILIFSLLAMSAMAQDSWRIKVGVNGLTCSACTRSVEMSLRRLDFIDSVAMSLEDTEGVVTTKAGSHIDFNQIAKAVTNAGFSVRFLKATFSLENTAISVDGCFAVGDYYFHWIRNEGIQSKQVTLRFVDEPFLPGKEFNRWRKKYKTNACFPGNRIFHVTNELE